MGVSFSFPFANCSHLEDSFDSIIANSLTFAFDQIKTPLHSANFNYEAKKTKEMDDQSLESTLLTQEDNPKHMAAIKLQKVYKSFRTRRKLADCAILIEQSWYITYMFTYKY